MTGALESEWSRSRGLEMFLFVCFCSTVSDTHECQHNQLFANPVLLHLSPVHFVQNVLVCVLELPKYFV